MAPHGSAGHQPVQGIADTTNCLSNAFDTEAWDINPETAEATEKSIAEHMFPNVSKVHQISTSQFIKVPRSPK